MATSLVAALLLGIAARSAAVLAGLHLAPVGSWRNGEVSGLTIFIAVFICGLFIWHRQSRHGRAVTLMSGGGAGVAVGLAA